MSQIFLTCEFNFVLLLPKRLEFLARSLECKLQLPKAGNVPDTRCHSAIYFGVPRLDHFVALPPPAQRACSSLVTAGKHVIHVLHWATEYATTGTRAERWVMMDIVSGLYQRRALGFPSHFVFGSAHSERSLRVFAGRWTLKQRNPASKAGVGCVDKQGISQDAAVATESGSVGVDQAQQTEDEYEVSIISLGPRYAIWLILHYVDIYIRSWPIRIKRAITSCRALSADAGFSHSRPHIHRRNRFGGDKRSSSFRSQSSAF